MRGPIRNLPLPECRDRLKRIREVLWPELEPGQSWTPDHFELVAQILEDMRLPTVDCEFCGHEAHERQTHRHDGGWVGPCSWDEWLRATE